MRFVSHFKRHLRFDSVRIIADQVMYSKSMHALQFVLRVFFGIIGIVIIFSAWVLLGIIVWSLGAQTTHVIKQVT